MTLLENWRSLAYGDGLNDKERERLWSGYFAIEKGIYEQILSDPSQVVEGTVKELAEKYHCTVPQIAMAWIYRQPLNCFAVVSTTKPERMQENIRAMELPLTEDEVLYLDLRKEAL